MAKLHGRYGHGTVVGLGKPAFTVPGEGPQLKPQLAESQPRWLGRSVTLVLSPAELRSAVQRVMGSPDLLAQIKENGRHRLREAGTTERIAEVILKPTPPARNSLVSP